MSKRRNPRLTYSEYVIPDSPQNLAVRMARRDLMAAVRRLHRPMLARLSADVFPAYDELARSGFDFDHALWNPQISPHSVIYESRLESALHAWAKEFHAEQDWFLDETLRILHGWYVVPDWREALRTNTPVVGGTLTNVVTEPFSFSYQPWEPELLSWADYKRKLREEFDKKVAEYELTCRRRAESCGLVRAPYKYSKANLDFFVLYQFAGFTSTQIANDEHKPRAEKHLGKPSSESAILKAIRATAKLLGWNRLRHVPQGRPKAITRPRKGRS